VRKQQHVKTQTVFQRNYKAGKPLGSEFMEVYAEFAKNGTKVLEKTFDETPQLLKVYKAIADTTGRLLKESWKENSTDSVAYKYDSLGRLKEERWYWGEDKTKNKITHYYNSDGKMNCTISQYDYGKIVDSIYYNDKDLLGLTREYDENGQVNTNLTNIYDQQGRRIEEIKTNNQGQMLQKISHQYYPSGLVKSVQTSYYSPLEGSNKLKDIAYSQVADIYKYDRGQLVEQNTVSENNNEKVINNLTTFDFDENGLLTEMAITNLLTKEKTVFRYTYTYYK
jgi:YD repeat-containing protein